MRSIWYISLLNILILILFGCGENNSETGSSGEIEFTNPREVSIVGYTGHAMEPSISRDGNILFFNNLNRPLLPNGEENDTNIHYAVRSDDVTFQYMGEVIGANTNNIFGSTASANELDAVASIDKNNKFYFINTVDYMNEASPNYLLSIFRADYTNGAISNIESLPNLKNDRPEDQSPILGELNFDAEIHFDGDVLYFVEGIFSDNPFPVKANIGVATNIDGVFIVNPTSSLELAMVNTDALEYAPSLSTNMLELYFTRAFDSSIGIYVATRSSVSGVWQNVNKIGAIKGQQTEAPAISFDGKLLYYHQEVAGIYRVFTVSRE